MLERCPAYGVASEWQGPTKGDVRLIGPGCTLREM